MSVCIHRQLGKINGKMMCRDMKKLGPCPWYRAMICVPWDIITAVSAKCKMQIAKLWR